MIVPIIAGVAGVTTLLCLASWYKIVSPSQAHLVVTPKGKFVVSADTKIGKRKFYFAIPQSFPFIGRQVRAMDLTIKEFVATQETYEKGQARFNVKTSLKYRIDDVGVAAETFSNDQELQSQLNEIVKSSVRAVTVKYDVVEARSNKKKMEDEIEKEMTDDLKEFGLRLVNFQMVDFQDTPDSTIISDISKRREKEIEVTTRKENSEKEKSARIKIAENERDAKKAEIQKDQKIQENEQTKIIEIAKIAKTAKEEEYKVRQVQVVKEAEIAKEKANIEAEQQKEISIIKAQEDKETAEILKESKRLEGEGERLKAEETAKAEAAPIKAKGEAEAEVIKAKGDAEAEAKEKLQVALNKFTPNAINALTAEKIVEKDKEVGIANAKALENADLKIFKGSEKDEQGFNIGSILESTETASPMAAAALANKMARPNDLGLTELPKEEKKSRPKHMEKTKKD